MNRAVFLQGGGACGRLIEQLDWAATPLGPIESWPASLGATVANMLHTRQPMLLFWGPALIQFYNDSFVPSFGQGKHPTAMGQPARECWTDAWPVIGAQIDAVMARGEPAWFEDALVPIHRNGRMEEVFWMYSYSPAYDDRGVVYGTLVIVTETTGRVLAARRLQALADLSLALSTTTSYTAVFEVLELVARGAAADLPFIVVRDAQGVERAAGISRTDADIVARADPAQRQLRLDRGPAGPVWPEPVSTMIAARIGTKGHVLFVGISPRLTLDAGYHSFITQLVDRVASALLRIDNSVAAEGVQRQRDKLLTHAPVATALMIGPRHVYQLANPLYCRIVGRDPTGRAYLDAFPELVTTELPAILDRVYRTGEPFAVREMCVPLVRGDTGALEDCYFTFNLEPLRDDREQVYGMMVVAVDITDQVRARHTLEKIGEERNRVLSALEAANRTKDEFLAMLGHELRNPLAPIVTALELMHAKDPVRSPERDVIERQVKHVVRLVDDLLDVSRITRGMLALQTQRVDLADVITTAIETSRPLIDQRGHALAITAPRGIIVDGDEARLVQIVANLLTNAARYTAPGGRIQIAATTEGGEAIVTVADNGTGIAANLLPHVFESFVQGVRTPDRAEGGLGLGLTIVKNLVALHGGRVDVHSDGPGRGSTFTVRLPLAAAATEIARPPRAATAPGNLKRVLVVDDNEDAAELLGEIVRRRGHDVTIVHDPASALAVIGAFQPDIALLDIGLPGMDGYQLAARMRETHPTCRLIALTGFGQDSDRERTTNAGFVAHLVKPVKIETLLELLG